MAGFNSLADLETLFIEKLQEKYKLNKKDLKRAFSKFDKDNNGLLDLYELTKGIQLFLNGVKESQVQQLVARYDKNGDGKISYDEFLFYLTSRTAIEEGDELTEYSRPSSAGNGGTYYNKGNKLLRQAEAQLPRRAVPAAASPQQHQQRAPAPYVDDDDLDRMTDDFDASELGYGEAHHAMGAYPSRAPVARGGRGSHSNHHGHSHSHDQDQGHHNPYADLGSARSAHSAHSTHSTHSHSGHSVHSEYSDRPSTAGSEAPSAMDPHDPRDIESRVKIFMENMRVHLAKQANALRMAGKLETATARMPAAEMRESVARGLLTKAFQPYTGQGDGKAREQFTGVELPEFAKVLRSFKFPGAPPLRTETIGYLFDVCSTSPIEGDNYVNEEGRVVADPNILTDLLFGAPTARKDLKARGLNKVGSTAPLENLSDTQGRTIKGYVSMVNNGRSIVGSGPVVLPSATDDMAQKALEMLSVPLRFVSKKSRTVMAVPSNFDPICSIANSNQLPGYDLVRKHVFGMSGTSYSGNTLYTLPSTPSAFHSRTSSNTSSHTSSNTSSLHRPGTANRNNPDYLDSATIVYATAGLGVVHDLSQNKQMFFDGHNDDITCITVSCDGTYAATGQMGKSPMVHIWSTNIHPTQSKTPINTISNNFFMRGVCALQFSYDNKYIVCIGCDDNHIMGIFDTSTTALIVESPAQHGIPPQIKWIDYCMGQQHTEYITREHAGLCDLFATAGEHHLKIWSFRRPSKDAPASLKYKGGAMGKANATAAKAYLCCAFVACEDRTFDLVAGGSNGTVYLFRAGAVVATCQAFRAKVRVLVVGGDRVYCGGGGGIVKILDARTLTIMQQFNLLPTEPTAGPKVGSAGPARSTRTPATSGLSGIGASKPRPASAGPGARLAHRALAIKPKADLSAPKHAAGQNVTPYSGTAGEAIGGAGMRGSKEEGEIPDHDDGSGAKVVTGIAVVRGLGRVGAAANYLLVALGTGKVVRLDVGNALGGATGLTPRPGSAAPTAPVVHPTRELFHYHTGPVWGLAADVTQDNRIFATVCDDRKLMVWDAKDCVLIAKAATQTPSRCCHIDKTNSFIAVGATSGSVTVHYLADSLASGSHHYRLSEVAFRRDAKAEITEIKFAPSNDRLALGCRDDCIYVYGCELDVVGSGSGRAVTRKGTCVLKAMHRLRGHSSTITHLDWSYDSELIRSTCAAYELLCWDVETGRLNTTANVSDVKWRTHTCSLGFAVMGIWPPNTDGTDINAVDVVPHKCLIATANDQGGLVRLHNYPCVVRHAPGKEYNGHSSHVMNLKFMRDGDTMMTCGGNDRSVVVWEVRRDESLNNPDGFRR